MMSYGLMLMLFTWQDVIGAAETGSGKTLAFGLPIMQRLLEEREKADKMLEEKGEEAEKYAPKGLLRGISINPTRELALQVLIVTWSVALARVDIMISQLIGANVNGLS